MRLILTILILISLLSCQSQKNALNGKEKPLRVIKTEEQWKKELTPMQYYVLREKGTERAGTGKHWENPKGNFICAACKVDLFDSKTKFESGSGWPSFYDVADTNNVSLVSDKSHGMTRVEVNCASCGGHLGHVFNDGPNPTGLRYCINSVSIDLKSEKE